MSRARSRPSFRRQRSTVARTCNVLGLPPGTQSDAVAAGYGLLLSPLSVGVHRITVRAAIPAFGIAVDAKFIVAVEPPQGR